MKKILTGIVIATIAALFCLCLAGCGGSASSQKIGETVSSDIMDFTLNRVDLSYYSDGGVSKNSSTHKVSNADEVYLPSSEKPSGMTLAASKGRVLVCLEFTVKNNDRSTIDIGGSFSDWLAHDLSINYSGKDYQVKGYDLNNSDGDDTFDLEYSIYSKDAGETWYHENVTNYLLKAGEEVRFRAVGIAVFEPKNLSDSFKLKVNLLNSSKKKDSFSYVKE